MNTKLGIALRLVTLGLLLPGTAAAYPKITSWENKPVVVYENKQDAILSKDRELKLPFAVVTANTDSLQLVLNKFDRLTIYPKSKIQILEITEPAGFVPELYLLDGQIRLASVYRGVEKQPEVIVLKTPFFDLKLDVMADVVVTLDMKKPSIEVKLLEGVLPLEFFAYERKVSLKAGQSVIFTGELAEDGKGIKYDYLLGGRKIPKGSLSEVKAFDVSVFKQQEQVQAEAKRVKARESKRKTEESRRKQKAFEATFLCKKPFGQKDECAWWAENGKCFRQRCNVSGQWGDVTERPMSSICGKNFYVTRCDY